MHKCPSCGTVVDTLDVEFIFADNIVRVGDVECKLRPLHMKIFEHLVDAFPEPLAIEDVLEDIYSDREPDDVPTRENLLQNIYTMRKYFAAARIDLQILYITGGTPTGEREVRGRFLLTHSLEKRSERNRSAA